MSAKIISLVAGVFLITARSVLSTSGGTTLSFLSVRSGLGSPPNASSTPPNASTPPGRDLTAAAMEAAITDLMLGKSALGATAMGDSVKTIIKLIADTIEPKITGAHDSDQQELDRLLNEIKKCGDTKLSALAKAQPQHHTYTRTSGFHKKCRGHEAVLFSSKKACFAIQKSLLKEKDMKCSSFADVSKNYGTEKDNREIMKKAGSEKTEVYITRISTTLCGDHVHGSRGTLSRKGGWGGGLPNSRLDKYLRSKFACEQAIKKHKEKVKECKQKHDAYVMKRGQCNQFQGLMDESSCKNAVMVKDACESYSECYSNQNAAHATFQIRVKEEETDRKAEWRGLKRVMCLVKIFATGQVTDAKLKVCKAKTHSTDHLSITYTKVPPQSKCDRSNLYPSTGEYKRKEFAPLPALAKGVGSAACSGVTSISLTPGKGSPQTAKCTRVSLNGYYSAGGLVKCENGLDVSKSAQRNSCPSGTKIFSPATRHDWKTFIASAGALAAPHFIVDVTRPQNSCGGCSGHAMNSKNRAQKSWKTSDGSPWWLRSTKFGEPNGDYTANCFLGIGLPSDENKITINDGSCNYHSKSYYCQPVNLRLRPRAGSPSSCKCTKVDLTGSYTAGVLVKCEECLVVHRSTQKNSCPNGMKIFSPQNRQDWKTFIDSANPLRAPNWIIDITRPQNGCGGCKDYPMKSSTAQQATWRTSDGSAWWLRSTVYTQPDGDYNANCFLTIRNNPTSPDTIQFNDLRCRYHSRSYYCQPERDSKSYGEFPKPPGPKVQPPAPTPVYKTTRVHFKSGGAGQQFKLYMYDNICPMAAANMAECYRCSVGNDCIEYQKFASEDQFKQYTKYKWASPKMWAEFRKGTRKKNAPFKTITAEQFEARPAKCEKVLSFEAAALEASGPVYVQTAVHFKRGPAGKKFKQYMYKNICPVAAKNMDECYRCSVGNDCIEYQKFESEAQYREYTKYKWGTHSMWYNFLKGTRKDNAPFKKLTVEAFNNRPKNCVKVTPAK